LRCAIENGPIVFAFGSPPVGLAVPTRHFERRQNQKKARA
jgi:hypothetical protein